MRKLHFCLILAVSLVLLWWKAMPGSQSQPFDSKKSQQELEIMKGILRTTLDFAAKELQGASSDDKRATFDFGGFSNISAFYLYGQGAVFAIPTSSLRHSFNFHWEGLKGSLEGLQGSVAALAGPQEINIDLGDLDAKVQEEVERAHEEVDRVQEEIARAQEKMELDREREGEANLPNLAAAPAPPAPAAPQAPPAPAAPPASPKRARPATPRAGLTPEKRERLQKRLAEAQEKVKKRQEELERNRAKFREQLAELKVYLIEALANHGDSLSVVKPNEYINLIMTEEGGDSFFSGESRGRREIISVQKSAITEYKAGRINLEAFKQKVLDYNN
jgi:hypothetical protein